MIGTRPFANRAPFGLLLAALCAATAAGQDDAARTPSARVGRAAPPWTGALELRHGEAPRPVPPPSERDLLGAPVVLVAPRAGADRASDVAAAHDLVRVASDERPEPGSIRLVVAVAPGDDRAPDEEQLLHRIPEIDSRYGAPPRPWVAIHDRRGIVRAIRPLGETDALRNALEHAKGDRNLNRELIGTPMEPVTDLTPRNLPTADDGTPDLDALRAPPGGLALYRFWTDGCPHCRASLPALSELAARFDGFRVVPVHHRKSRVERTEAWLADYLADLDHDGPWAQDPDWTVLKRLMQRGNLTTATSVSFLVDDHGIIRWAHRGPRVHPDPEREHGSAGVDFATLERIVTDWCRERSDDDR